MMLRRCYEMRWAFKFEFFERGFSEPFFLVRHSVWKPLKKSHFYVHIQFKAIFIFAPKINRFWRFFDAKKMRHFSLFRYFVDQFFNINVAVFSKQKVLCLGKLKTTAVHLQGVSSNHRHFKYQFQVTN